MQLAPTLRDTVLTNGTARLYRFRGPDGASSGGGDAQPGGRLPVLVVPSLLNPWYVLDLRRGASVCEALCAAGLDTFCLDWGTPQDEDRYLTWDELLARLARAARAIRLLTGKAGLGMLGYSMGGTLAGIHAALHPGDVRALVNLAGPFDFSKIGLMGVLTRPEWFDAEAIGAAGNVSPQQMLAGFMAVRPTHNLARLVELMGHASDPSAVEEFWALETWANDNIPVPGAAYVTYIRELYQQNLLIQGRHHVAGRRVDLGAYRAPLLTVATDRDTICPVAAASALNDAVGSDDKRLLVVPGGHVSGVVGNQARTLLYPPVAGFFLESLAAS
jgi:polyhydroxyalkanoate synthase subunit PhaC